MLNKCCFIGNLGKDPESRFTQAGKEIVSMTLAVTEKWKDGNGERKERTEWVRIVVFNEGLGKVAKSYLKKGSKCYIEGQMQTRKWTDQAGEEKYTTEIVVPSFGGYLELLDSPAGRSGNGEAQSPLPESQPQQPPSELLDDEIPF